MCWLGIVRFQISLKWISYFLRKHPTRQIYKISVLEDMVSWNIVSVLTKFWESSPGNLIHSYCISFSWKSFCVLSKFWTRSLQEILMCSGKFRLSWKIRGVLLHLSLLDNLMCSRNLFKKSLLERKNRYFSKITRLADSGN